MIEINPIVGTIIVALIAGLFTLIGQRFRRPIDEAGAIVTLTKTLVDIATIHATTIKEQSTQSVQQTLNAAVKDKTIAELIAERDGLPLRVAELTTRALLDANYQKMLKELLEIKGIPLDQLPSEPVKEPLTPLVPVDLLIKLEDEKRKREELEHGTQSETL